MFSFQTNYNLCCTSRYVPELLTKMMKMTVEKTDDDRERMMSLISAMKADGQITSEQFMEVRAVSDFFSFQWQWFNVYQ